MPLRMGAEGSFWNCDGGQWRSWAEWFPGRSGRQKADGWERVGGEKVCRRRDMQELHGGGSCLQGGGRWTAVHGGLGLECGGGFRKEEPDPWGWGRQSSTAVGSGKEGVVVVSVVTSVPPSHCRLGATCFPHILPFTPHRVLGGRYDLTLLCR